LSGGEDFEREKRNFIVYALYLILSQCKGLRAGLIWEDFRAHVRENFGCAENGLIEYLVGCSKVSCSSQAWSARWGWQWYWLFCDRDMVGCSDSVLRVFREVISVRF